MVKKFGKWFYAGLIYVFMYLPIVVLIIYSFNDSRYRGNWEGFTLRWYAELIKDRSIMDALKNTILIAVISSFGATVLGTMAAIGIFAMKPKVRNFMVDLTYLPVTYPEIVIGVSLLALYVGIGLPLGFWSIVLSHITFCVPFVVIAVLPKLYQLNPNLEEAAMDLGATPSQAFWKVILPEIMPGVMTGMLLSFTLSLDDFLISFFTTGSGVNTLAIKIYSMTKVGVTPKINALTTIIFVTILTLLLVIQGREKKVEK
ncbi:MAG TPA: ABC transporter permease [Bacillota bacterium]|nr:ABC transporter permease [Bacillota bacterium]HOH09735.1 ABC transporter permease [Bacillota bacterium]HOY88467.1 ABC transporter permease [Bacillota bacterium]HPI00622.1 ABC transporter permease [Bacillota bacterium]HPM63044.1 ABC transporter permease [Bacillota bacterium]